MKLNNSYKILFLVFVILGVYYPAIFAGSLYIDDLEMMARIGQSGFSGFNAHFIPGSGFYYRPLLTLTYLFDKAIWDFDPGFMHLENIIIHVINTVLVFSLAQMVFKDKKSQKFELPLLAALLFGLHPINTESVNWISGRTDPLASSFMLLALIFLIKGIEKRKTGYVSLASMFMLLGVMSKEMLIFIYPAAIILILFWKVNDEDKQDWKNRFTQCLVFSALLICCLFIYGLSRWLHHQTHDGAIQLLLSRHFDFFNSLRIVLKVFGFYVKKLFLPVPLNFAIISISNAYVLVGIAASVGLYLITRIKTNYSLMLVAGAFLVTPAILIAMVGVAWTPLAERYMYFPSVFFCIGITGLIFHYASKRDAARIGVLSLAICLIPVTTITAQRNILWQNHLAFYKDTREKSPGFAKINNEIAISLLDKGELESAENYIRSNRHRVKNDEKFTLNLAKIYLKKGDIEGARTIIIEKIQDKNQASLNILKMLAVIDEKYIFKKGVTKEGRERFSDLIDTYEIIYKQTHDPYQLYRAGQLSLAVKDKTRAASFFRTAASQAPESAYYKKAAVKLAEKFKSD